MMPFSGRRLVVDDLDEAIILHATTVQRGDGRGIANLAILVGGGEAAGKLRKQVVVVSRADPGAQNRRDGERRVETLWHKTGDPSASRTLWKSGASS
ncbi:hypothetical protein HYQ46_010408 [Verticillium longisporum]|nr:hypothetical protein HYQ46_010408 [Verticillium longisporum]